MYKKLGAAIDAGTTTIALYLVDLTTGGRLGCTGGINAQAAYGADVTSRIQHCAANGFDELTKLIREQLDEMASTALQKAGCMYAENAAITQIVIAGNTIMQHFAAGYCPVSMGTAPFTPLSLFGETLAAWDTFPAAPGTQIYYAPCVSAYVGGDITAGLLAAGLEEIDVPALFIDIGTNGEIVLKHKNTYYCCAAAAGPAFESKACDGLYGSQLIDILADLLENGAVDKTGRLTGESGILTAQDIRGLQLAKAAIAGGIRVLLRYAGIETGDIKHLALAGGFGSCMKPESAARIGLIPEKLLPVTEAYGNTAGEGAVMTLCSGGAHKKLDDICSRCEYIELSSNAYFNEVFIEEMKMPTA